MSDTTTAPSRDEREATQPLDAHTASAPQQAEGQMAERKKNKKPKSKKKPSVIELESTAHLKVFVGGLSQSTTNETLHKAFTGLGFAVQKADVLRDPDSDRSRGFGFVEFNPKIKKDTDKFGQYVEVDFNLEEHFWGGSDQPQQKTLRIDGVDCGVYAYGKKSEASS
jgi:hypothetical protein